MTFCEPLFLFFFFPALLLSYYVSPPRHRNVILTVASLLFYAAGEYKFLGWLTGSIALNYVLARGIEKHRQKTFGKSLLILGIVSDLALLAVFKYAGFFVENLNLFRHHHKLPMPSIVLPLGISFFTFHKISYKIDVWRASAQARRDPRDLALYILLFPQLVAGPIIRYHDIASELVKRKESLSDFIAGAQRFCWGLGKKMLLANTLAQCADSIFGVARSQPAVAVADLTLGVSWLAVICYTLQIYFDFSGYSDMAIGLGQMFGFHFPENFNHPYLSTSITEFWQRWHISLSRWFRDYVYIPLGGNRCGPARTYANLFVVFFLCGFWHGASWNFVVWGLFHGALLVAERIARVGKGLVRTNLLKHVYTLTAVAIGWVLFRCDTLAQATGFLRAMFGMGETDGRLGVRDFIDAHLLVTIALAVALSGPGWKLYMQFDKWLQRVSPTKGISFAAQALETALCAGSFVLSCMLVAANTYNPFIYFRF